MPRRQVLVPITLIWFLGSCANSLPTKELGEFGGSAARISSEFGELSHQAPADNLTSEIRLRADRGSNINYIVDIVSENPRFPKKEEIEAVFKNEELELKISGDCTFENIGKSSEQDETQALLAQLAEALKNEQQVDFASILERRTPENISVGTTLNDVLPGEVFNPNGVILARRLTSYVEGLQELAAIPVGENASAAVTKTSQAAIALAKTVGNTIAPGISLIPTDSVTETLTAPFAWLIGQYAEREKVRAVESIVSFMDPIVPCISMLLATQASKLTDIQFHALNALGEKDLSIYRSLSTKKSRAEKDRRVAAALAAVNYFARARQLLPKNTKIVRSYLLFALAHRSLRENILSGGDDTSHLVEFINASTLAIEALESAKQLGK